MSHSYFARLWRQSKLMFIAVIVFIFFQALFNVKRIHSFPWIVWDMYSREVSIPDTATQTEFFIDGKRLDVTSLSIWEESTILHTLYIYRNQKSNGDKDPIDAAVRSRARYFTDNLYQFAADQIENPPKKINSYPLWLKKYLEDRLHQKIKMVEIKDVRYQYDNKKFTKLDEQPILKIE